MEKSGNYPQMPSEMSDSSNRDMGFVEPTQMSTAPPSYDQATGSNLSASNASAAKMHTTYTLAGNNNNNNNSNNATTQQREPPHPTQQPYPTQQQYGGDGGIPAYHGRTYMAQQQQVPMVQQPVVIIQQQAILPLGPDPTFITCPACHIQKLTRIEYEPSSRTHLMAALLCILGLWCCVCVPYCAGSCMNTNHYCGNCNKFLGTYGGGGF